MCVGKQIKNTLSGIDTVADLAVGADLSPLVSICSMRIDTSLPGTPCAKRARPITTEPQITKKFRSMSGEKQFVGLTGRTPEVAPLECVVAPHHAVKDVVVDKTPQVLLPNDNVAVSTTETKINTPPHHTRMHDKSILQAYMSMRAAQQEVYATLGLADNDAITLSEVTRWTLHIANKYTLKEESVYGGLYLYYTYTAHVRRHACMDDSFELYKRRQVMLMQTEETFGRVVYGISDEFLHNIADMKCEGHHLGQNSVFDFITVERDVVQQLAWRLFRVESPTTFLQMLFHEFAVSCLDQLETHSLVRSCLMSSEFVLALPCDLAVFCLASALCTNYGNVPHVTELAQLVELSVEQLMEQSCRVLALRRIEESGSLIEACSSLSSLSSHDGTNSSPPLYSMQEQCPAQLQLLKLGDGAVDEVETL